MTSPELTGSLEAQRDVADRIVAMRIHPPHITEAEVVERRRLGLDHHDEEWEGVYHVTPSPTVNHQDVLGGIYGFLKTVVAARGGGRVLLEVNVFRKKSRKTDYRVPDLAFVCAGREEIVAKDGTRGGAPDVVIEILSPRDESYAKFGFFAAIGVAEIVIVEPEARRPEIWKLEAGAYTKVLPGPDGTLVSERMEVSFRTLPGEPLRLEVVDRRDASRRLLI